MVERVNVLASELAVRKTFSEDLAHCQFETLTVIKVFAIVETKHLLVKVPIEMERLNRNIGAMQLAFYEAPKVLKAISVNAAIDVLHSMVNNLVPIFVQSEIALVVIGVQRGASLYVRTDGWMHRECTPVFDDLSAYSSAPLHESHDGNFVFVNAASEAAFLDILVHVASFATNVSLIYFDLSASASELAAVEVILQSESQPLKHEPCRLLRDAERPVNLHTGNAVPAINQHPKCRHPLVKAQRRIFKDRAYLHRELFLARFAEPYPARLNEPMLLAATARADDFAIRPAEIDRINKCSLRVGEVNDCFLKCLRLFHKRNCR